MIINDNDTDDDHNNNNNNIWINKRENLGLLHFSPLRKISSPKLLKKYIGIFTSFPNNIYIHYNNSVNATN